jgi:hypothetical protein
MLQAEGNKIHLPHQLAPQTHLELILIKLCKRTEVNIACRANQGVKFSDLREELLDRRRISYVYLKIATLTANSDDLVTDV